MFSYGADNCIDFSAEPLTQLVGLNGRGKSSIPLILEEVLFNKNSKGIKKGSIVNRNLDTNKYNAELTFDRKGSEYSIQLSRSGATQKVKLLKDGVDISSHTATGTFDQIEHLIGLDFKTFSQVVYQSSTSSLQFLTATDSNRKKFLIDLLSLDRYLVLFEALKTSHKAVVDKVAVLNGKKDTVVKWLEKHKSQDLTPKVILPEPPEPPEALVKERSQLQAQVDSAEATNKKITKNQQYKALRDAIVLDVMPGEIQCKDTKPLVSTVATIEANVKATKATIARLQGLTSQCPTCLQEVKEDTKERLVSDYLKELDAHSGNLTVAKDTLKQAEEDNSKHKAASLKLADFEKYSSMVDAELPSILIDKEEIQAAVDKLSAELGAMKVARDKVRLLNSAAEKHNASIATIEAQIKDFSSDLDIIKTELETLENELVTLDMLKKAFSTNGLVAYKIENSVKDLEELTNSYLSELSDGRFQLTFTINNDKLNVVIIDNGVEIEISALSAGELARVTTATLLAIRKLMASLSKTRINVLFLDETIDTLDTFGKEKLVEVLLREPDLNTFLISHGYSHPLLTKIEVVKENGISRLEDS